MENLTVKRPVLLILLIFMVISLLLIALGNPLGSWGVDMKVLLGGNLILFLAALLSFYLFRKGLQSSSTGGFLRMTYSGMFLKMGICILSAVIYGLILRSRINKPALLVCFLFYFIYTFAEVSILLRLSKQQKDA